MIAPSRYTPSAHPGEPGFVRSAKTSSTAAVLLSPRPFALAAQHAQRATPKAASTHDIFCDDAIRNTPYRSCGPSLPIPVPLLKDFSCTLLQFTMLTAITRAV